MGNNGPIEKAKYQVSHGNSYVPSLEMSSYIKKMTL